MKSFAQVMIYFFYGLKLYLERRVIGIDIRQNGEMPVIVGIKAWKLLVHL